MGADNINVDPLISIVCVSLNNIDCVELLLRGLERNTYNNFEVLLHGNCVTDENKVFNGFINKWIARGIVSHFTKSVDNLVVSKPANALFKRASGKFFVFMDDDVYPAEGWDQKLIEKFDDNYFFQMLTPILFHPDTDKSVYNIYRFGDSPRSFDEDRFNNEWLHRRNVTSDKIGGVCGNFLVHRELWQDIGGYDEAFRNGHDVDLKAKIFYRSLKIANEYPRFIGVSTSCLYHFAHQSGAPPIDISSLWYKKWNKPYECFINDFNIYCREATCK